MWWYSAFFLVCFAVYFLNLKFTSPRPALCQLQIKNHRRTDEQTNKLTSAIGDIRYIALPTYVTIDDINNGFASSSSFSSSSWEALLGPQIGLQEPTGEIIAVGYLVPAVSIWECKLNHTIWQTRLAGISNQRKYILNATDGEAWCVRGRQRGQLSPGQTRHRSLQPPKEPLSPRRSLCSLSFHTSWGQSKQWSNTRRVVNEKHEEQKGSSPGKKVMWFCSFGPCPFASPPSQISAMLIWGTRGIWAKSLWPSPPLLRLKGDRVRLVFSSSLSWDGPQRK